MGDSASWRWGREMKLPMVAFGWRSYYTALMAVLLAPSADPFPLYR
jgi:hypothetical protein